MQQHKLPMTASTIQPAGKHLRQHRAAAWSNGDIEQVSAVMAALAHPLRLSIVTLLADGERSVSELCDMLWSSQPNISHHLWILHNRNLVFARKDAS